MLVNTDNQEHIIFSIDDENNPSTRLDFETLLDNNNIGYKRLTGCYEGLTEVSYIINAEDYQFIYESGYIDFQESILWLTDKSDARGRREAFLHYNETGELKHLGWFGQVSREEALKAHCWTYRKDLDAYFITKEQWNTSNVA